VFPDDSIRSPGGAEYTSAVWRPGNDVTLGAYLQEQWRIIDHLEIFGGARGEWNQPRSDGDFVVSPRGGVIGRPLGDDYLLLKYSFNTGFRRPNWWQARWPLGLFGNYFELVADKPEYSQNHDIQAIWNPTDRIKLNAVYWFLRADDMIFSANTASGGRPNWVNAGNFLSDGLELRFDWNFMERNLAGFNTTWTRKATFQKTVDQFNEESFVNADGRFLDYPEFQANIFTNWQFSNGLFFDLTLRYMTNIPGREPIGETADLSTINDQNREVTVKNIYYLDAAVGAKDLGLDGLQVTLRGLNVLNNRERIPRGQGDHDLYEPAPTYVEAQVAYTY
jgi:outer membrane receptor for ferrienterochelin and colicin